MSLTSSSAAANTQNAPVPSSPLDAFTLPMHGARLIEASAGTGKTYTIANLYLRLLLGIGESRPFGADEILVVTFTNAATSELRDRIRRRVQDAFKAVLGEPSSDPFMRSLLGAIDNTPLALRQLDLALKTLDEASIYTIHGFCQRILSDLAFESALLFESEFTLDDSEYLTLAAADFWRAHCYGLSNEVAAIIHAHYPSPKALESELRSLIGARMATPKQNPGNFTVLESEHSQRLSRLRLAWKQSSGEVIETLKALPLNGTSYGKAADGFPKLMAHFEEMDAWAARGHGEPPLKALTALAYDNIKLNKGGVLPQADKLALLVQIGEFITAHGALIPAFLLKARDDIRSRFAALKAERNLLAPDDLLLTLAKALGYEHGAHNESSPDSENRSQSENSADAHNSLAERLAAEVASRYPIALIDEFQDTDPLQFAIFSAIYRQAGKARGLLMIGDPKQAIYAFRGGDIHTYLSARNEASAHYNLGTNYRSSRAMVDAVNRLFQARERVFMNDDIPFEPVNAADKGQKALLIDGRAATALEFAFLAESDGGLNKQTARTAMASDTAEHIARLLNLAGEGRAILSDKQRPLKAKDIAVLVRDRNEAAFIKAALAERSIGAVFLSRDNVLATPEARELMHLLYAIAHPRDERRLRAAMATRLLGYTQSDIARMNQDEDVRAAALERFEGWHQRWQKQGVMPALMALADDTGLLSRLQGESDAERRLTDFRHLCELLEHAAAGLDGISALLGWYEQALANPSADETQQMRLESEQNLVQIVTIHKSKGLEYGLCYIPFLSLARDSRGKPSPMLYHSDNQLVWDIEQTDEGNERFDEERLAEDLRLLYVALTRPVYACRLGLANHSRMLKGGISSEVFKTALGYLLGIMDKNCDGGMLKAAAMRLCSVAADDVANGDVETIAVVDAITDSLTRVTDGDISASSHLSPRQPNRHKEVPWRVGSYSALVADSHGKDAHSAPALHVGAQQSTNVQNAIAQKALDHKLSDHQMPEGIVPEDRGLRSALPGAGDESFSALEILMQAPESDGLSRFSFPRGANAGSFMHLVLELIRFDAPQATLPAALEQAMAQFGIEPKWQPLLMDWYQDILAAPLNDGQSQFALSSLNVDMLLVEMEFFLPVTRLKAHALGDLLALFHYRSDIGFDTLNGMLKGFIDLIFCHDGRYYVADYKSNHLGDELGSYHQQAMQEAIGEHHYDLQYLLYTLALHRLLRSRLADYDYDRHIGGCFYLFLRGMSASSPGSGVFFDKPPKLLINALDALFEGNEVRI
ncbi:UvrD-helicase domain-containing protein [Shewanella sp. JM162201]|uniref:RecBCD enzyme subunit RecB n=1 Tax=Shewanella jiangmenensis TaxID=2837387 RepID=A0ABS5V508_9GAMM|nr:UvrD-helicase domain-containing protein [Shewanella jiangmenensis]MBT1445551.1 UvrD-helicase domain-containing protein [Shewanella jiangmenensis]